MKILALDLGTTTGYACGSWDGADLSRDSGTITFVPKRGDSPGMKLIMFNGWVKRKIYDENPDLVVYEMPHHRGGYATALLNQFVGFVVLWCIEKGVNYHAVHSGTLKKWACGHGRASKEDMVAEAGKLFSGLKILDDDHADALLLYAYAMEKFCA